MPRGSRDTSSSAAAYAPIGNVADDGAEPYGFAEGPSKDASSGASTLSRRWTQFVDLCHLRVSADTLCVLRIGLGLILVLQHRLWMDMPSDFTRAAITSPYVYFEWTAKLVPSPRVLQRIMEFESVLGYCIMLGVLTKAATVGSLILFSLIFSQSSQYYNNHYLFIIWIHTVGAVSDWGKSYSVDAAVRYWYTRLQAMRAAKVSSSNARRNDGDANERREDCSSIPYWMLWTMQFLYMVPYFFGGIAKVQYDWIYRNQPFRMWFKSNKMQENAFKRLFHDSANGARFISYGGVTFDLCEPVLLLSTITVMILSRSEHARRILSIPSAAECANESEEVSKRRPMAMKVFLFVRRHQYELLALAFAGSLGFNTTNKLLMNIGVFPYAMIWSLVIFLPPGTIDRYVALLICSKTKQSHAHLPPASAPIAPNAGAGQLPMDSRAAGGVARLRRLFGPVFVCVFVTFHMLWPLRGTLLLPPFTSWHEEGHIGAWNMKLRSKSGDGEYSFHVTDVTDPGRPESDKSFVLPGSSILGDPTLGGLLSNKYMKLKNEFISRPYDVTTYLRYMRRLHEMAGYTVQNITAESCQSLNGRPYQHFYIKGADLNQYIDSYWYPFNTCVGKWVEPLVPLPWFADEEKLAAKWESEYPHCVPAQRKFSTLIESQLEYYDLHRRAGLHLIPHEKASVQPGLCIICLTPKDVPPSRITQGDVVTVLCSVFFRYYEYYTSLMDTVSVGHPMFNATQSILEASTQRSLERTIVKVEAPRSSRTFELVKEVAVMYGLDVLYDKSSTEKNFGVMKAMAEYGMKIKIY